VPDVFLVSRRDLAYVMESDLAQPVGDLLDQPDRDVDFSDGYTIDAVRAFAGSNELQCMPYGYSPMVIYYNTDLIDFTRMARRGLNVPSQPGGWSFDEFAEAARFASRPATRSAGVYIDPTLQALAPFIYSGGGSVFDDPADPKSLAFSDGGSRAALGTTLELLRNPLVTLSDKQLSQRSALDWFKAGKLGMIAGFRSLTPELRKVPGLNFDVMAMPNLGDEKTVGEVTGLCMSKTVQDPDAAADFIYYASGDDAVSKVAQAGYLVPANLEVASSDAFLQPGQMPATMSVFNDSIRNIVLPPLLDDYPELDAAVSNDLRRLFSVGLIDLVTLTEAIDADSTAILDPESVSPSASP
jgi:multiple sugar transport system substrate-binding protein